MEGDRTPPERRATVAEAARILDTTAEAVRSRIKRRTLRSVKEAGTVYVLLSPDQTPPEQGPDADQTVDQTRPDALIDAKDETIALLRTQLEAERQAHAEARRLLMAALERIPPQLGPPQETPPEPRESPTEATEQPGRVEPQAQVEGAQEPAERRPWWQRWFGG